MKELSDNHRLVLAGFRSEAGNKKFEDKKFAAIREQVEALSTEEASKFADNHDLDISSDQLLKTGYPTPGQYYHITYESFTKPLESFYFWSLNHFNDLNFAYVDKITDVFSAAESSALFGLTQQRLGIEQDKVTQFLTAIGRLVKDLFQIVREIRIIKERLKYYNDCISEDPNVREPAEVALKGLFVDLVEGGTKNAGSVFGLAREVGFVALPDLFFSVHPKKREDIKQTVERLVDFNAKVKEILIRKLYQYIAWRESTHEELKTREKHTTKYLRQHYDAVQLYMGWIKPYLKHITRLGANQKSLDTPSLIAAFEGSTIEIEILGRQLPKGNEKVYTCLMLSMKYRTSPTLPFQQEYQRGPLHVGNVDMIWRSYAWTEEEIEAYKSMRNDETFEMLALINKDIQEAMNSLGKELRDYLESTEEGLKPPKEEEKKKEDEKKEKLDLKGYFEPFTAPFEGFGEMFKPLFQWGESEEDKKKAKLEGEKGAAKGLAIKLCWTHYKNFKKIQKLATW